jgi:hypothetical protein
MPLKPVPVAPTFRWNSTAGRAREGRYVDSAGRFVSRANVRTAIDGTIESGAKNVKALSDQLRAGQIDVTSWRNSMMQEIKLNHLANAAAAKGGWDRMAPADILRAGREINQQYRYVNKFAEQVTAGTQKLDGTLGRRANMYADAGRATYESTVKAEMRGKGMTLVRNVLHPADHCQGCLDETDKGWVDIELSPDEGGISMIGSRLCKTNDKCSLEYQTEAGDTTG